MTLHRFTHADEHLIWEKSNGSCDVAVFDEKEKDKNAIEQISLIDSVGIVFDVTRSIAYTFLSTISSPSGAFFSISLEIKPNQRINT